MTFFWKKVQKGHFWPFLAIFDKTEKHEPQGDFRWGSGPETVGNDKSNCSLNPIKFMVLQLQNVWNRRGSKVKKRAFWAKKGVPKSQKNQKIGQKKTLILRFAVIFIFFEPFLWVSLRGLPVRLRTWNCGKWKYVWSKFFKLIKWKKGVIEGLQIIWKISEMARIKGEFWFFRFADGFRLEKNDTG